ncbi:FlgO family outer membrane protein [Gayadomonas joobiniege]|uniref:FlgO family outer membrane protein n=1 Tax=Gayadomonas joobiniege TaxID=1234606 RepID=UPI00037247AC|nr:FlgO family outer membrane protein [Gayadomonas joobiniege]
MKPFYISIFAACLSASCSNTESVVGQNSEYTKRGPNQQQNWQASSGERISLQQKQTQDAQMQMAGVSDYVAKMARQMAENAKYISAQTPIAVTSFVPLDSTLETTSLLGLHIAESFLHHMQSLGLEVVDYKTTGIIRVTEEGDFAFSRDTHELQFSFPIEYILSGTYVPTNQGIEVNARLINVKHKNIVASSQAEMKIKTDNLFKLNKRQQVTLSTQAK